MPENWTAGRMVRTAVPNKAATWLRVKAEITSPREVAAMTYSSAANERVMKLPFDRHTEGADRQCGQHQKVAHRHHYIGDLLAEEELQPGDRGYIEIDDGTQFFFPHY